MAGRTKGSSTPKGDRTALRVAEMREIEIDGQPMSFAEIGRRLGITRMAANQAYKRYLEGVKTGAFNPRNLHKQPTPQVPVPHDEIRGTTSPIARLAYSMIVLDGKSEETVAHQLNITVAELASLIDQHTRDLIDKMLGVDKNKIIVADIHRIDAIIDAHMKHALEPREKTSTFSARLCLDAIKEKLTILGAKTGAKSITFEQEPDGTKRAKFTNVGIPNDGNSEEPFKAGTGIDFTELAEEQNGLLAAAAGLSQSDDIRQPVHPFGPERKEQP